MFQTFLKMEQAEDICFFETIDKFILWMCNLLVQKSRSGSLQRIFPVRRQMPSRPWLWKNQKHTAVHWSLELDRQTICKLEKHKNPEQSQKTLSWDQDGPTLRLELIFWTFEHFSQYLPAALAFRTLSNYLELNFTFNWREDCVNSNVQVCHWSNHQNQMMKLDKSCPVSIRFLEPGGQHWFVEIPIENHQYSSPESAAIILCVV